MVFSSSVTKVLESTPVIEISSPCRRGLKRKSGVSSNDETVNIKKRKSQADETSKNIDKIVNDNSDSKNNHNTINQTTPSPQSKANTTAGLQGRVINKKNLIFTVAIAGLAALSFTAFKRNETLSNMENCLDSMQSSLNKNLNQYMVKNPSHNTENPYEGYLGSDTRLAMVQLPFPFNAHNRISDEYLVNSAYKPICGKFRGLSLCSYDILLEQSTCSSENSGDDLKLLRKECPPNYEEIPLNLDIDMNNPLSEEEISKKFKEIKNKADSSMFNDYHYAASTSGALPGQFLRVKICKYSPVEQATKFSTKIKNIFEGQSFNGLLEKAIHKSSETIQGSIKAGKKGIHKSIEVSKEIFQGVIDDFNPWFEGNN